MNAAVIDVDNAMRPVRRKSTNTVGSLVASTRVLIETHGLRGFTIDDIAKQAGVSRTAFYHHFANVDELVEAALIDCMEEHAAADLEEIRALGAAASREQLRTIFNAYVISSRTPARMSRRIDRLMIVSYAARGASRLLTEFHERQREIYQVFVDTISDLQRRSFIHVDLDVTTIYSFLYALTFGSAYNDVTGISPTPEAWQELMDLLFSATEPA